MTDFDYKALDRLKADMSRIASTLPPDVLDNYNRDFDVTYAHDSTQIEGNTLSLVETKVLLEDGISIGGKKLREVYEVTNHDRAFTYVRQLIREGRPLDEELVKDIHEILMQNIMQGLADDYQQLVIDFESVRLHSAAERIVRYLLREMEANHASSGVINLDIAKGLIASQLNLTQEHFSRILNELHRFGLIILDGRRIEIPQVNALQAYIPATA